MGFKLKRSFEAQSSKCLAQTNPHCSDHAFVTILPRRFRTGDVEVEGLRFLSVVSITWRPLLMGSNYRVVGCYLRLGM